MPLVGIRASAVTLALFSTALSGGGAVAQRLVLRDAEVVDVRSGEILSGHSVVVDGQRIVAVAETGQAGAAAAEGATVVDASGMFLIPGLWDMHVHLEEAGAASLGVMAAWGVTSVRDMGTSMATIRAYRESAAAGLVAPRIKAAGMMITNPAVWSVLEETMPPSRWDLEVRRRLRVGTPEEARAAVLRARRDGADFVKLHWNASRETYVALAEACREAGLTFAGHDPLGGITIEEIAVAGQRSVEHLDGAWARAMAVADPTERERLYGVLAQHETHFVPTVTTFMGFAKVAGVDDLDERMAIGLAGEEGRYVTDAMADFWRFFFGMYQQLPPVALFEPALEQLRLLHAAGIPMMPGTDLGAPLIYPGSSLHDELGELVDRLEMSPAEALRSATLVPAAFFGMTDLGAVEEGMLADLVLLERNPLESIANTRTIHAVVLGGRYLGPAERSELFELAARKQP